ncbi:MAG: helix-turn-helix transcriptional regulator [Clostridiales bacterium]|nr:helix-turn-helix transcriptional regulator [Clostridiales bacterium]
MGINYKRLWKLLIDREMTKTELRQQTEISSSTLSKMSKNEYVSLEVLVRICCVLNCELSDIVEIEK